jgi:hypothetical protein
MFDDSIREKANAHEAPVPPDAWDNIVKKKKKRRLAFWWWSGSALLLMGISLAGYFLLQRQDGNNRTELVTSNQKAVELQQSNEAGSNSTTDVKGKNTQQEIDSNKQITSEQTKTANDQKQKEINTSKAGSITIDNATATITITNGEAGEENKRINRKKELKKSKGRLLAQQTSPGVEEMAAVKVENNSNTQVFEETESDSITTAENKNVVALVVPDKKAVAIEEKKTPEPVKNAAVKENTAKKQSTKKHWFIEASAMPVITSSNMDERVVFNRTLSAGNSNTVYNGNLLKTSIEPAIAFSLAVRKECNKKFSMGAGLQYLQLKENLSIEGKEINTTYTPVQRLVNGQLVPDTVVTVSEGTRSITALNSYRQFSIPVFMQYSIIQKKQWSVSAVGGMYINISSSYQNEIDRNAAAPLLVTPAAGNKTQTGMDVFAGVRIGKTLGRKVDFFVMPSMRWNLTRYTIENSLLNRRMNQAGVGFGVCYNIK